MREYSTVFGMDVHSRSVTVTAICMQTGEVVTRKFPDCPSAAVISEWMHGFPGPHWAAYESGCTGFHMCRELRALEIHCDVIAVSSIPRAVRDARRKTDKRDSMRLAQEMAKPANDLSVVWLPDVETEGARDLARALRDAQEQLTRAKQHLVAFLLRHGHVWNHKTKTGKLKSTFTSEYMAWLASITFEDEATAQTYEWYRTSVSQAMEYVKGLKEKVARHCQKPRWKPYVDGLSALKAVTPIGAFTYAAEFGDFRRFKNGRSVSSWTGLTPSLYASGESSNSGGISKCGNRLVRFNLIEAVGGSVQRITSIPKAVREGQVVSDAVLAHARTGSLRLKRKAENMKKAKKHTNVIKCAVASELARWIWVIGCMVQEELDAAGNVAGLTRS